MNAISNLPTFAAVTVGQLRNTDTALNEIARAEVNITETASEVLQRMSFETDLYEIDLVVLASMHMKSRARKFSTVEICDQAKELGLIHCPPEAALQLWLENPEFLQIHASVILMMDSVSVSSGEELNFHLERRNSGRWLDTVRAEPTTLWNYWNRFLFAHSR